MIKVGILAATGIVDQEFIEILEVHRWSELALMVASGRSAKIKCGMSRNGHR